MTPKRGDLVIVEKRGQGIMMHHHWRSRAPEHPTAFCRFSSDDVAIVLETLTEQGGNGCRIAVATGKETKVGWVNVYLLKVLQNSSEDR